MEMKLSVYILMIVLSFFSIISKGERMTNSAQNDSCFTGICVTENEIDSIIFYYKDFSIECVRNITRQDFVRYSIYGVPKGDYCAKVTDMKVINGFLSQLRRLKCDSIMPYDSEHINCKIIIGNNGRLVPCEEISADLRCMAILFQKESKKILWFSRFYAFGGKGRYYISEEIRNSIDKICKER